MPAESRSLAKRRLKIGQQVQLSDQVVVKVCGMGKERALAAAEKLIDGGASRLLSWGCAAALDPACRPGQMFCPDRFQTLDNSETIACHPWAQNLYTLLANQVKLDQGLWLGVSEVIADPKDKQTLYNTSAAVGADMESAYLAQWSHPRKIPFAVIRSIADDAFTSMPAAILAATTPDGDLNPTKLAKTLLRSPNQIAALIRLGRQFRRAERNLAQAAQIIQNLDFRS